MPSTREVLCALAVVALAATSADAAMITFTHEGAGSGTIDGVAFGATAPAPFIITATGDTSNRVPIDGTSDGFGIPHASASITIDGVGTFDFTSPTRSFVNNTLELVGFSRSADSGATGSDLFNGPSIPALAAWDMLSSIGPISGDGVLLQWNLSPVQTTGGVLSFANSAPEATFTAVVVPTPAPLALAALPALALTRRRRRTA